LVLALGGDVGSTEAGSAQVGCAVCSQVGGTELGAQAGAEVAACQERSVAEAGCPDVLVDAAEVGSAYVAVARTACADAELSLSRLAGVFTQVAVMALLVAAIAGGVVGLRRNELILVLVIGRYTSIVEAAGAECAEGRSEAGLVQVADYAELGLRRLAGIFAQVAVMALLVTTVVSSVVVLRALGCTERAVTGVGLAKTGVGVLTVHGIDRSGRLERLLVAAVLGLYVLSAIGGRRLGVGSQVRVMALLVSAVVGRMILLGLVHCEILL